MIASQHFLRTRMRYRGCIRHIEYMAPGKTTITSDGYRKEQTNMLQVNHIHLSYGPRLVLDDVSFTVAPGEKAGLIGVNGAGKSSLLKIIAGLQETDRGNVGLPRSHGYLSQDVAHETSVADGITVRDYIFQ